MLSRLNGIFAFALWDRSRQSLLLARDALGVKPLYFAASDDDFVFASEIKALMQLLPVTGALDVAALQRYLTFLWCPGEGTPLRSVRKLLPGEAMFIRSGRMERRWNWYRLPALRRLALHALDQTAASQGTREHLLNAVRRQMIADVPVALQIIWACRWMC